MVYLTFIENHLKVFLGHRGPFRFESDRDRFGDGGRWRPATRHMPVAFINLEKCEEKREGPDLDLKWRKRLKEAEKIWKDMEIQIASQTLYIFIWYD